MRAALLSLGMLVLGCNGFTDPSGVEPPAAPPTSGSANVGKPAVPPTCCQPAPLLPTRPGGELSRLVQVGQDYHAEIVLGKKGAIKVFPLGADGAQVQEVEVQRLEAQMRLEGASETTPVYLEAKPQEGDSPGKTSQFVGTIPRQLWEKPLFVTMQLAIDRKRYRFNFPLPSGGHAEDLMPLPVPAEEEKLLYLTPGGKYTEQDIKANGQLTASQKYDLAGWVHELRPNPGEKVCPITLTKANPDCTWVIGGKKYEFCCPPCIDAFLQLAKEEPDAIKDPEAYRKK